MKMSDDQMLKDEPTTESVEYSIDEKKQQVKQSSQPEYFRKVFVGSLNYSSTEESLRDHFSKYGELVDCVIMKESKSGKSRGFGFVTYSDSSMVDEMMKHRPHKLDGRELETKRATPREEAGKPGAEMTTKKLFVGAIKEGMTDEHLREYFCKYGIIEDCIVMKEKETNKSRGFGFVTFDDYDPVDKIVLEKNHIVNNQTVAVKKALPKEQTVSGRSNGHANSSSSSRHNPANSNHHHSRSSNYSNGNSRGHQPSHNNNNHHHHHQPQQQSQHHSHHRSNSYNNISDRFDHYNDDFNSNSFNDHNSNGFNSFANNGYNDQITNGSGGGVGPNMSHGMDFTNFALMAQKMLQAANMAGVAGGPSSFNNNGFPPANMGANGAFGNGNQIANGRQRFEANQKNSGGGPMRNGHNGSKRNAPYNGRKSK